MATARKRPRQPLRGRALVAIGLALFLVVSVIVVWRRSVGATTALAMRKLDLQRRSLLAERAGLERAVNDAMLRQRIVPAAERLLGLHVATESQTRPLADTVSR